MFLNNLINWVIQWTNFIRLLMTELVFTTRIISSLYLFRYIWSIVGLLLGIYRRQDDIYLFILLLLLKILYNNGFNDFLLEILHRRSL